MKLAFVFTINISLILLKFIYTQSLFEQEPRGIHLVYGEDPSSQVNIIWWTQIQTTSAIVYYSLVDLENEDVPNDALACNHNMVAKGYLARNLTHGKAIHRVYLSNLLPNRRYCYEIASGHASSHIYTFRTASLSIDIGIKDENFYHTNFILNGNDFFRSQIVNKNENSETKSNDWPNDGLKTEKLSFLLESIKYQMLNKQINALINLPVLNLKEYIKNDDNKLKLGADVIIDKDFLDYYSEILSNIQILPAVGNYENSKTKTLFRNMFPMNGHMPFSSHFYSLNANGVHFITFSADLLADDLMNQEFDADQSLDLQFNWLENDLAKANENRHLTPWIIVFVSESIDCANPSCSSTKLDKYKKKIEALLYEYDVDLVFDSNDYIYERTYPTVKSISKYQLNYDYPEMPVRISLPKYSSGSNLAIKNNEGDEWSAFKFRPVNDYTYGLLEIINSTLIRFNYYHSNDSIIDELSLVKDHNGVFERVFNERKHFLETNSDSNYLFKSSKYNKATSGQTTFKLIFFLSLFSLLVICIVYVYVKRHLKFKKEKLITNYSNLIENDFET